MRFLLLTGVLMACQTETTNTKEVDDVVPDVVDADGDGFSEEDGDCDDRDAQISPNAVEICDGFDNNCDGEIDEGVTQTFYADTDGDGFGNSQDTIEACDILEGYVVGGNDCDDTQATVFPAAQETCDGLDNDCDGTVDEEVGTLFYIDADGDGVGDSEQPVTQCAPDLGLSSIGGDCDDNDPTRSPNAFEICDEIDNDCDEEVDEGVTTTYYFDDDGDGFGDLQYQIEACEQPIDYVTNADDCDDINGYINPLADEVCDDEDNDCDGFNNEPGSIGELIWYIDSDADGFGHASSTTAACEQPVGYVANYDDCDDGDPQVSPNAVELCDSIDNDCDGVNNEAGSAGEQTFYADTDNDGFGDGNNTVSSCSQPIGYTTDDTDCDDTNAVSYPGNTEICDGFDNDCNGDVDGDAIDRIAFYLDEDGDGYGGQDYLDCTPPTEAMYVGGDCDDTNADLNLEDGDGDGFDTCSGDCNDADSTVSPIAAEICDGQVNTCGGILPSDEVDDDGDGFVECTIDSNGWDDLTNMKQGGDCDDGVATLNPNTVWYADVDVDGFGDAGNTQIQCQQPIGYIADNTDCDDGDVIINPDTVWYADTDLDGFGNAGNTLVQCLQPSGYILDSSDCDDTDSTENPTVVWYADVDGDSYGNSSSSSVCSRVSSSDVLNNTDCDDLDATEKPGVIWYSDVDGDSYGNPSASSTCERNAISDVLNNTDCDDGDSTEYPGVTWYSDVDGDSYGNPSSFSTCERSSSTDVLNDDDCDDSDSTEKPGVTWYADVDGDSYGNPSSFSGCSRVSSSDVLNNSDCDDLDAAEKPGVTWYADLDGDSYGNPSSSFTCSRNASTDVLNNDDCDDSDSTEYPGVTWYSDVDGDTYGNPSNSSVCSRVSSSDVLNNSDCDDLDADEKPGVVWYPDGDGDGYGASSSSSTCARASSSDVLNSIDCNDSNAFLTPADSDGDGVSTCSGDCDDSDASLNQTDVDGDGYTTCDGDCNDASASASPVGVEDCYDGLDNDCDGIVDNGPVGTIDCPADTCGDVNTTGLTYVDQGLGGGADWYYCENDTDGGGWTLAYWNSYGHHATTSAVNRSSLGDLSTHAKLVDSEISGIATAGFGEVMVKDHNTTTIYIKRYTTSAWGTFSSTGWRNQSFESMDSNGNWQSGCNGHRNNRGISTYSDNNGAACPIVYQGSSKYFVTWHTSNYSNGVGGEFGVYVR